MSARIAGLWLAAAMSAALALMLWFGRETTFSVDEFAWFATSPGLGLDDAVAPHAGHLLLTTRVTYAGVLEAFGSGYEPFRLLTGLAVLAAGGLFFVYASRRVGRVAALAPTLILLVFGSDSLHVLVGNGFTTVTALACGIGALLCLDRADRRGDLAACALLCLGVVTYTVALAFVVGAAVRVLLGADRRRRIWIALVPLALYAVWWLWALGQPDNSESQLELVNVLSIPSWSFQALAAVLEALTGLGGFGEDEGAAGAGAGAALALVLVGAVGWRLWRGAVPATLWAAIAIALTLWAMQAIAPTILRAPDSARYLFPGAVAVLLVAAELGAGIRWTRAALIALYAVCAVGVATNVLELRDEGNELRDTAAVQARTDLGALELTAGLADPAFDTTSAEPASALGLAFGNLAQREDEPLAAYLEAADAYGGLGYSPEQIQAQSEADRNRADGLIVAALGVALQPAGDAAPRGCRTIDAATGTSEVGFELPPRGAVLESAAATGPVEVRRFATVATIPLAGLAADEPALLSIPADAAPQPWQVSVPTASLRVCGAE